MRPINVAIVGLGFMAATHLKAYRKVPGGRIAALCNPSGRNLDGDFSKVFGNVGDQQPLKLDMSEVKAYRNFAELLADDAIDLVDICSPTTTHHELAIAALLAGKHVICEKPMARTSQLAREMAEVARQSAMFLMPAMCVRFWPEYVWAREAIISGKYGKTLSARFRRVAEPPAWGQQFFFNGPLSGGALLDLHIHDVDFVQYCFGRPRRVFASGYTKFSGAIDHVVAQYQFASGIVVHAEGGWAMSPGFGFNASFTINFQKATLDFDLSRGSDALKLFQEGHSPTVIKPDGEDGYAQELAHILESVRSGKAPTMVTPDDGVQAIELCEAEEASIRSGQPELLA